MQNSVVYKRIVGSKLCFWQVEYKLSFSSVQFSCSVVSDPVDCSTLGFPVHNQPPELAQTRVHQVGDAI